MSSEQDQLLIAIRDSLANLGSQLERTNALLEHLAAVSAGTSMRQATETSFTHTTLVALHETVKQIASVKAPTIIEQPDEVSRETHRTT